MPTLRKGSGRSVRTVQVDDASLTITLWDGRSTTVPVAWYPLVEALKPDVRKACTVSPDGRRLVWPGTTATIRIDEILPVERRRGIAPEDRVLYAFAGGLMVLIAVYFAYTTRALETLVTTHVTAPMDRPLAEEAEHAFLQAQLRVVELRYRQAAVATLAHAARNYSGFLVGTLLTLMGSLIVVRRVRSTPAEADLQAPNALRLRIVTSSPGLFAATLGAAILIAAMITRDTTEITDDGVAALAETAGRAGAATAPQQPPPAPVIGDDSLAALAAKAAGQ